MAGWKHRLEWVDEANKTAGCSACGVVDAYYRPAQDRWQCSVARREQKGTSKNKWRNRLLTRAEHATMLEQQNGLCLICKEQMSPPCVDHCHSTGKVRGMLCNHCNRGLGCFKDDKESLKRAIQYLGG